MEVVQYNSTYEKEWNRFIQEGKNSTFLFNRSFLEYHEDRFKDYSLIIIDNDKIISLLPANITDQNEIISHQGLTYGGFVFKKDIKLLKVISVVYNTLMFLNQRGITNFMLKQFPSFYNSSPTSEIDYSLFLINAKLFRRDVAFVVDINNRIPYSGNIRREAKKAKTLNTEIKEDDSLEIFWNKILVPGLAEKHGVKPVHSFDEIAVLKERFPNQIKQFNIYLDGAIVAGTTLFVTPQVVHCQYISSNELGRKSGSLNLLFQYLLDIIFIDYKYFDFGIVNEDDGRYINKGMLFWKESFGGRSHNHDFYKIETESFKLLEQYI